MSWLGVAKLTNIKVPKLTISYDYKKLVTSNYIDSNFKLYNLLIYTVSLTQHLFNSENFFGSVVVELLLSIQCQSILIMKIKSC